VRILGIDPGTKITGFGIIENLENNCVYVSSGIINLSKINGIQLKLSKLYSELIDIIDNYNPTAVALEDVFYAKNIKSTMKLAYAKGAVFLAASHKQLKVYEYSPTNIKSVVSGYGRADKGDVGEILKHIIERMPDTFTTKDESDAIALAYCHYTTEIFKLRTL
jgi:crossover junction endodeoxyribonuclease RuvC